jgi:hypothetical protein
MSEEVSANPSPTPSEPQGLDLTQALWQLRLLVCGIGAAVLVLSLSFNLYVWKQNRNIVAITNNRVQQVAMLDTQVKRLTQVVNDLGNYSVGKPELMAIFSRYGLELKTQSPPPKP